MSKLRNLYEIANPEDYKHFMQDEWKDNNLYWYSDFASKKDYSYDELRSHVGAFRSNLYFRVLHNDITGRDEVIVHTNRTKALQDVKDFPKLNVEQGVDYRIISQPAFVELVDKVAGDHQFSVDILAKYGELLTDDVLTAASAILHYGKDWYKHLEDVEPLKINKEPSLADQIAFADDDEQDFIVSDEIEWVDNTYTAPNALTPKETRELTFYLWTNDDLMGYVRDTIYRENDPWKVDQAQNNPDFIYDANFYAVYNGSKDSVGVVAAFTYVTQNGYEFRDEAKLIITSSDKALIYEAINDYCLKQEGIPVETLYLKEVFEVGDTNDAFENPYAIYDYRQNDTQYYRDSFGDIPTFETVQEATDYLNKIVAELTAEKEQSLADQIAEAKSEVSEPVNEGKTKDLEI